MIVITNYNSHKPLLYESHFTLIKLKDNELNDPNDLGETD